MKILCLGDVVGKPGRLALEKLLDGLKKEFSVDTVVANVENAAGGAGLTSRLAKHFLRMGCDVLTVGDHVWDQKEMEVFLNEEPRLLRPANFPDGVPGKGWGVYETASGTPVAAVILEGRVFMRHQIECPFRTFDKIYDVVRQKTPIVVVDFHAEATSEKIAFARYVDGRASVVFGTHTHVQTADETVFPGGTAYITDVGMTGPYDSVIGQEKDKIIRRYLLSMPVAFKVAKGDCRVSGIVADIDDASGKARKIERVHRVALLDPGVLGEEKSDDF